MLERFGTFLGLHPIAGAFLMFFLFICIQKLSRLADRYIEADSDSSYNHQRNRENIERIRAGGNS